MVYKIKIQRKLAAHTMCHLNTGVRHYYKGTIVKIGDKMNMYMYKLATNILVWAISLVRV